MMKTRHDNGLILVAVLWLLVILIAAVTTASLASRVDSKVSYSAGEQVQGRWLCKAGVEKAIDVLQRDGRATDGLEDVWNDPTVVNIDEIVEGHRAVFSVVDEAGKLNVNFATKEQLMALPYMTEDIAGAIIDWRDSDSDPTSPGAEGEYYQSLQPSYPVRNGPIRTVRELLLVKGVTPELMYGAGGAADVSLTLFSLTDGAASDEKRRSEDRFMGWFDMLTCYSFDEDKDAHGNARININKANESTLTRELKISQSYAKWITANRKEGFKSISDLIDEDSPQAPKGGNPDQAQKIDLQTFAEIADRITVHENNDRRGRVNINTASRAVLRALLEDDEKVADDLISYRDSAKGEISSIAKLLDVKSLGVKKFKKIADHLTVRSNIYLIRGEVRPMAAGAPGCVEAVVGRSGSMAEIIYWHQGASF